MILREQSAHHRTLDHTGDRPVLVHEEAERLEPLTGVKAYPARVKCATLCWHAFEAALKGGDVGATVKTE